MVEADICDSVSKTKPYDNAASKGIIEQLHNNKVGVFIPTIISGSNYFGFGVDCRLPDELYFKWISTITGSEKFREHVEKRIRGSMQGKCNLEWPTELWLHWQQHGLAIETGGVNGCGVYVPSLSESSVNPLLPSYTSHNIDNLTQALVLQMALSIYMKSLMLALDSLESYGVEKSWFAESKPLSEDITVRIQLRENQEDARRLKRA